MMRWWRKRRGHRDFTPAGLAVLRAAKERTRKAWWDAACVETLSRMGPTPTCTTCGTPITAPGLQAARLCVAHSPRAHVQSVITTQTVIQ